MADNKRPLEDGESTGGELVKRQRTDDGALTVAGPQTGTSSDVGALHTLGTAYLSHI